MVERALPMNWKKIPIKTRNLSLRCFVLAALLSLPGCRNDNESENPVSNPTEPSSAARASFVMTAKILGPVDQDDASDIEITLRETGGVGATLHRVRLTCNDGSAQEWGAGSFVSEFGTNITAANSVLHFTRSYRCPSSGRPSQVTAFLTDHNGFDHSVDAQPYHPDWPGQQN